MEQNAGTSRQHDPTSVSLALLSIVDLRMRLGCKCSEIPSSLTPLQWESKNGQILTVSSGNNCNQVMMVVPDRGTVSLIAHSIAVPELQVHDTHNISNSSGAKKSR